VLDRANAVEEVTVLTPLITEGTAKIARFGGDQLDHSRERQLEGSANEPRLHTTPPRRAGDGDCAVHPCKVQIVCESHIKTIHRLHRVIHLCLLLWKQHDLPVTLPARNQLVSFDDLCERQNVAHLHFQLPCSIHSNSASTIQPSSFGRSKIAFRCRPRTLLVNERVTSTCRSVALPCWQRHRPRASQSDGRIARLRRNTSPPTASRITAGARLYHSAFDQTPRNSTLHQLQARARV
jgi:hypothetical protein